ncbi:MAG: hypothetical protein ACK5KN_16635 [Dysgonomonas sp.]|uniref:hypothetical protein n=1 Tax=Dysgonomonas sp. TaxID=1891233 RepID=UPI003A89618C
MTSNIKIGNYTVKPHSVKWKTSVLGYMDTCTIVLPRVVYTENILGITDDNTIKSDSQLISGSPFNAGDKVAVYLGYDNRNEKRFAGFVKYINIGDKLEVECEGYSYQLPKVFNKSYANASIKAILTDLTAGTDIKLSAGIPDSSLGPARFKNFTGYSVLDWLKKECQLTAYFDFDAIYVGTMYGLYKDKVSLILGWNTADEKEFKKRAVSNNIIINIVTKDSAGTTKKVKSDEKKYSQVKEVKVKYGMDAKLLRDLANDIQNRTNYGGYQGSITCFLEPVLQKSTVADIKDNRFPERSGLFFVEAIEGSFDSNGGRQKVTLSYFYGK